MRPIFLIPLILFSFCGPKESEKNHSIEQVNPEALKKQFIEANKKVVQKESDEMDYYAKAHQMSFVKTPSGIRYFVYEPSAKGDSISDTSTVLLKYRISLLDGTECYISGKEGKRVKIGQSDIESGMQRSLLYLKRGDKALVLIPSHLAHGLLGDMKKIPPQMPIVYDVEVH